MKWALAIAAVMLIAGWGIAQDATLHPTPSVHPDAVPDPTSPAVSDSEARPGYYNQTPVSAEVPNYATDFERGNTEYADLADTADFDPTTAGRGTCIWLKAESAVATMQVGGNKSNGVAAQSDFYTQMSAVAGDTFSLQTVFYDNAGGTANAAQGVKSQTAGVRYFICYWWDGAGDDKVHLQVNDGAVIDSAGTFATANNGTCDFGIGSRGDTYSTFDGVIDTTIHYEGGFPSSAVRTSMYNGGDGKTCGELTAAELTNAVACWDMTEDGGPYLDSIGSNDLTAVNTPTQVEGLIQ